MLIVMHGDDYFLPASRRRRRPKTFGPERKRRQRKLTAFKDSRKQKPFRV